MNNLKHYNRILVLALGLLLAACGGEGRNIGPEGYPSVETTHRVKSNDHLCGLKLNNVQSGDPVVLSYNYEDDQPDTPPLQVKEGESLYTPDCGTAIFTGETYFFDEHNNAQVGGAGFSIEEGG